MAYPEYDFTTLPAIEHPYNNEKEATKKYLGGRAITGEEYATLNIFATTNAEANALYEFWKTDCVYGTLSFLVPIPFMGETYDRDKPNALVQFIEDLSVDKEDVHWKQTIRVKVVGTVDYIYDDLGAYITDDSGAYIYTDTAINSNTEITYA